MGDKVLGKKLKEARERLKLTQEEVGKKVGVSGNWYARVERGEENASQDTQEALFKLLKIKVIYKVN